MSADTSSAKESGNENKGKLTLEMIIRRPKFTQSAEMRNAVNVIYSRQFASHTVLLKTVCPLRNRSIRIDDDKKEISIVDMGTCNKFLDCFAPSITKLKIEYSTTESELKHRAQLDRIVNKYCAEYVTDITLQFAPKDTMMKMKKPFAKAESVEFIDCCLTGKLPDFNYYFPNLKKLIIISDGKKIDGKCVAKHFPNLEYLGISVKGKSGHDGSPVGSIEKKHVAEALLLNPQLQSFEVGSGFDTKFLKEISKYLQNIHSLKFHYLVDNLDSGTIHFKGVKKLDMDCFTIEKFPLSFDHLEELSILNTAINQNDVIDFIMKHSTIIKLNISPLLIAMPSMNQQTKMKLSKGLPSVTHIIFNIIFSVDEVICFLTECKSLRKMEINMASTEQYEILRNRLQTEWNVTAKPGFFCISVTLERAIDQNLQPSEKQ